MPTAKLTGARSQGEESSYGPMPTSLAAKPQTQIAKLTARAGAASVSVVSVPGDLTNGWDLADPVPDNLSIAELLASARAPIPEIELPAGYAMAGRGLVWRDPFDDEKPELLLAGQFQVLAETRDGDGKSWGVLLEWNDHDGRRHRCHFRAPRWRATERMRAGPCSTVAFTSLQAVGRESGLQLSWWPFGRQVE